MSEQEEQAKKYPWEYPRKTEGEYEPTNQEIERAIEILNASMKQKVEPKELANLFIETIPQEHRGRAATLVLLEKVKQTIKDTPPKPPQAPKAPDPFNHEGQGTMPNNPYQAHATRAIVAGGKGYERKSRRWRSNTVNQTPQYHEEKASWFGGTMTTYLEFSKYGAPELWARVKTMDAITLDVYLTVCALLCDSKAKAYPGSVTLHPGQVMELKAFQRRGADRRIMERRILDAARTLSGLRTDIVNVPVAYSGKGAARKPDKRVTIRGCALFHLDGVVYLEQGELFTDRPKEYPEDDPDAGKEIVAIHLLAGQWARQWMNANGEKGTVNWTSAASRALLEFGESKTEQAAKRFGALLLTMPGGTDPFKRTQTMTHAEVLEAIGELPEERGWDWGRRAEQMLYGAEDAEGRWKLGMFDLLKDAGLLANYEKAVLDRADRGRGWVDRWLQMTVSWTATEAAKQIEAATLDKAKAEIGQGKPRRRSRVAKKPRKPLVKTQRLDAVTAAAIRDKCARLNWSRDMAAKHFGVAGGTLSNVLTMRYAPGPGWAHKLQDFLDNYPEPE